MPVSVLLCEGTASSPDARVLSRILMGRAAIHPLGGKYGMGDRIKARREILKQNTIYGILDGDFDGKCETPTHRPRPWVGSDQVSLGWRWERKEIENYLIDPEVVRRALGEAAPEEQAYLNLLSESRDSVATYQAARLALTVHRPRFAPLPNQFGAVHGFSQHLMPDDTSIESCAKGIEVAVLEHNSLQTIVLESVEAEFQRRRPECEPGGSRYAHFLNDFAGKDLVCAMANGLEALGFQSPRVFLERILVGIDTTTDDVATWLIEWAALRDAINAVQ